MIQQDTPTKKICSYSLPWENSHTIVNHKIYQTLQPDFNFGFGSRSSKSSPRRVREPLVRLSTAKTANAERRLVVCRLPFRPRCLFV